MNGVANPWLPSQPRSEPPPSADATVVAATGPTRPQHGVPAPDQVDRIPTVSVARQAPLWVLGAHGGAGAWSVASLVEEWAAADHTWPVGTPTEPTHVVVVARTNARGLIAAKHAARQWASGLVPGVQLLGLVHVADAPGRLPKELRDLSRVVGGGYPRTWTLPWIERWRLGHQPDLPTEPREVRRLVDDLRALLRPGATPTADNRKDRTDGPT